MNSALFATILFIFIYYGIMRGDIQCNNSRKVHIHSTTITQTTKQKSNFVFRDGI